MPLHISSSASISTADICQRIKFRAAKHPNIPVVCYVNSTAEVKAESDVCCTSANAVNVVCSLNTKEVLFVPDQHLGKYVESQLSNVKVITYDGFCPIHHEISVNDVIVQKQKYPSAQVMVHPECKKEVTDMADFVGSTTAIIKAVKESTEKEFIIVTEKGVVDRLNRDCPDKKFILIKDNAICDSMKLTTLENILSVLEKENNEIVVPENIAKLAINSIEKMVKINS